MRRRTRLATALAILAGFMVGTAQAPPARATALGAAARLHTVTVAKGQTVTVRAKRRTRVVVRVVPGAGTDYVSIAMHGNVEYYDGQHGIVNVNPASTTYHNVCVKVGPCKCPEGTWQDGPAFDESVGLGSFTITLVGGKKSGATAVLHGAAMDSEECTKRDPCLRGTWKVTDLKPYLESFNFIVLSTSGTEIYTFRKNGTATAQGNGYSWVAQGHDKPDTLTFTLSGTATGKWTTPQKGELQIAASGDWTLTTPLGPSTTIDAQAPPLGPWGHESTGTYVCTGAVQLEYYPLPGHPPIVMTYAGSK